METEENNTIEPQNNNQPQQQIKTEKPTNWWKVIAIVLFLIIAIYSIVMLVQTTNKDNPLTSRAAKNSDISIKTDMDWSSLGTKIVITPKVDIDSLKITVNIQNNNKTTIYTTQKHLGDVKQDVETSCSVTLSELGWTNSLNAKYVSVTVSGGTVSYFN